ncbi:MAG: isoprenylcysteine carboxylmethyltransferase family protein [Chryseolinea sp.]
MNITFPIVYTLWFLSEVVLNRLKRSGNSDKKDADKNSLLLIWIVVIPVIVISSYLAQRFYIPILESKWTGYAGLIIMIVGIVLRLMVIKSLGRFFTVDVTIREDHQLKKDGFYSVVRHPSYSASWLSFAGYGISLNNWVSFLLVSFSALAVFMYRIKVEEKVLIGQFGDQYLNYKKSTKAIIPFLL